MKGSGLAIGALEITSSSFNNNEYIPSVYTCEGKDMNPPLIIKGMPSGTETLAIIVDDPDAPNGTFTHWVVWNIPPREVIGEGTIPGLEGINDFKNHSYGGPCPPSGTHRYFFKVYALDTTLYLNRDITREALEIAMQGHILAYGELVGLYEIK